MPVTDVLVSDRAAFRADMARSARLLRAFRTEQTAPDAYYTALARDTVRQLGQYADLDGLVVADVGGGRIFHVSANGDVRQVRQLDRQPADISYIPARHLLMVPHLGLNRVSAYELRF